MQQFYKNVVDSKVFGKRSNCGVIKQLLKEANPIFLPLCRSWGDCDNSISYMSEDTAHRDKSTCIATFCLTFYGSWNFRFLGRNGIARLSGMTANYFSMILF